MENEVKKEKKKNHIGVIIVIVIVVIAIIIAGYFIVRKTRKTENTPAPVPEIVKNETNMPVADRYQLVQIGDTKERVKEIFKSFEVKEVSNTDGKLVESFTRGETSTPGYYEIIFTNGVVTEKKFNQQ